MRAVRGFTLIEMMIVVAILGIITAIAYPSYLDHVFKTRRSDAKIGIMEALQAAQRFRSENGSYDGFGLGTGVGASYPNRSPKGYYTLTSSRAAATASRDESMVVWAVPIAGEAQAGDTACQRLVLTSTGATSYGPVTTTSAECWGD